MLKKLAKKNNKGFSLVELIVVILIMAIIAVALAPQVIKYVNKSRESVAESWQANVRTVAKSEIALWMEDHAGPSGTITIANDNTGTVTYSDGFNETLKGYIDDALGEKPTSYEWEAGDYTLTVTDGVVTVS